MNTVDRFQGLLKSNVGGVYKHVERKNLHRHLAEFDFRYNAPNVIDSERAPFALQGAERKRLIYRDSR